MPVTPSGKNVSTIPSMDNAVDTVTDTVDSISGGSNDDSGGIWGSIF